MASFQLLDTASEDALHKSRLFNTDEKAFRRIAHCVLGPDSLLTTNGKIPSPPKKKRKRADSKDEDPETGSDSKDPKAILEGMRDDILLEFSNFESSLVRMQFLLNSNEQERKRYASEKIRIQATAQDVKGNTAQLRVQLQDAQNLLSLRKEYDELAEKITSNRLLKPREDQLANIEKLNSEIAELERESKEYATTWAERREQFGKIIEEGMQLRRLIRDEKEEVERREGMEGRDEHEDGDAASTRARSNVGTPRPEAGGATPLHPASDGESNALAPDRYSTQGKSPFRVSTPIPEEVSPKPEGSGDRLEESEVSVPEVVSSPSEGLVAEDGDDTHRSGSAADDESDRGEADTMDTS